LFATVILALGASISFAQSTTATTPATATAAPAPAPLPGGQPISPELARRIANTIRGYYSESLPGSVQLNIGNRYPSEVPGFDMLHVDFSQEERHRNNDFLLSKDGNKLVRWLKIDVAPDPMAQIDIKGRPVRGNKDAKVTIVSFDDFECPYCSKMHQTLFPELAKTYGDRIRIIYKDYPLDQIHPWAIHAAVDANCLAAQNNNAYWEFADLVHGDQKKIDGDRTSKTKSTAALDKVATEVGNKYFVNSSQLQQCLEKQDATAVKASIAEGDKLDVSATPTLFINGERMEGAAPEEELRAVIDRALKTAGVEPPAKPEKSAVDPAAEGKPEAKASAPAGTVGAAAPAKK
jgi:protein-disulfide isomerase